MALDNQLLEIRDERIAQEFLAQYLGIFNEDPEYIMAHAVSLMNQDGPGGMTIDYFREMLVVNDFEFIKTAAARNEPAVDEMMVSVFETMEGRYPDIIETIRSASPDADLMFARYFGPEIGTPDIAPLAPPPETDTAPIIPAAEEAVAMPAIPSALPSIFNSASGILSGPIAPTIRVERPLSFEEVMEAVNEIKSQLTALPENPAEMQSALQGISDRLEELAITLTPALAGDPRLQELPPHRSGAPDITGALGALDIHLSGILVQLDQHTLSEYLVGASQKASIAARTAGLLPIPEVEVETEVEAEIEAEAIAAPPEALPEIDAIPDSPPLSEPEPDAVPELPVDDIPEEESDLIPISMTGEDSLSAADAYDALALEIAREPVTRLRLSELLDGKGFHNDTDGYSDFNAMQDAFQRAVELGIDDAHVHNIQNALVSEDMVITTAAAIEGLKAYNSALKTSDEGTALRAFFNSVAPEDFIVDRENSVDDHTIFDPAERDSVRDETLRQEQQPAPVNAPGGIKI